MGTVQQYGLILALCIGVVVGTECSADNRAANLTVCLEKIIVNMYDPSLFWFGTEYSTNCPNGPADGFSCQNPSPSGKTSIGSRIFDINFDENLLSKFINVEFTADPGQYTGCGNTFTSNQTVTYNLDPTSSEIVRPWYVRHTPEITWEWTEGEYYSLYVYDVGHFITHAVYINIQRNDIPTSGENLIDQYHGPLTTQNKKNPYVFLLFKQNGFLNPQAAQEWYNATNSPTTLQMSSHIPDFIELLNMTGPIAMNWLVATGDEYAAYTMYERGILATCPVFVGQALDLKPRPFLPKPASLSVQMDIMFQVDELNYYTCCVNYTEQSRSFKLNPIGNELLNSASTRSGLAQDVTFEKLGFYTMSKNFTGDMYTMIAMDPDVPSTNVGNESHPLLHQMKINIMDGNFTSGEDVIPWSGPYPPNDEPHYYYFLLYKHTERVNRTLMMSYDGDCSESLAGRCLYDINRAVGENNFTLVGANWFRAKRDSYVRYRKIQGNPNVTHEQCMGQPGYTQDCEDVTSSARRVYVDCFLSFIMSFACIVVSTVYM